MAHAQKPDFFFQPNRRVHLNRREGQFSRLLAVEVCGSSDSDCIIFSKYVDLSLKISLQGRKKRVKRGCESEIVFNAYKFMKNESEVDITVPHVTMRRVRATIVAVEKQYVLHILSVYL